jgi:hypothetical protein
MTAEEMNPTNAPTLWDTLAENMLDAAYSQGDEEQITQLVQAVFNGRMPPARLAALIALQHGGYHFYSSPLGICHIEGVDVSNWLVRADEYHPSGLKGHYTMLGLVATCPNAEWGDLLVSQVYNPDQCCFRSIHDV